MNKAEDIEQLIYRELPPDRYCYIHNFILEKDKEIERLKKYEKFVNKVIITPVDWNNENGNYKLHNMKKKIKRNQMKKTNNKYYKLMKDSSNKMIEISITPYGYGKTYYEEKMSKKNKSKLIRRNYE